VQIQGALRLGAERDTTRDADLTTAFLIEDPLLGPIELVLQQGRAGRGDADEEDADLAVVLLAEPAAPLAGHAGGVVALLGRAPTRQ
jgi:hypothetical protein